MIIEAYAMDSVVNRTLLLKGHGTSEDDALRLDMTFGFFALARVAMRPLRSVPSARSISIPTVA